MALIIINNYELLIANKINRLTIIASLAAVTRSTYAYVVVENWDALTSIVTRIRKTEINVCITTRTHMTG